MSEVFPHGSPDDIARAVQAASESGVGVGSGQRYSKDEANYRPAGSSSTNCGECKHFQQAGSCELVSGMIAEDHVSDYFEPLGSGLVDLITQ